MTPRTIASPVLNGSLPMQQSVTGPSLQLQTVHVQADILDLGRLQPWLGPAIRGMVLRPLMERLCILDSHAKAERLLRIPSEVEPRYCRDCVLNPDCSYGRNWEPDRKLIDGFVRGGMRDGLRSLTIGALPLDSSQQLSGASNRIELRLMAAGNSAISLLEVVLEMIEKQGKEIGLGADSIRFQVDRSSMSITEHFLEFSSLPTQRVDQPLCSLALDLTTPLFLKTDDRKEPRPTKSIKRNFASHLTFRDLLSNSVRTVRRAINEFSDPDWSRTTNLSGFFEDLDSVVLSENELIPFGQSRVSHRQDRAKWEISGFQGQLKCTGVNAAFVPWLKWAGLLGVGDSRNCGAGVWTCATDQGRCPS